MKRKGEKKEERAGFWQSCCKEAFSCSAQAIGSAGGRKGYRIARAQGRNTCSSLTSNRGSTKSGSPRPHFRAALVDISAAAETDNGCKDREWLQREAGTMPLVKRMMRNVFFFFVT